MDKPSRWALTAGLLLALATAGCTSHPRHAATATSAPPTSAPPATATSAPSTSAPPASREHHIGDMQLAISDDPPYRAEGRVTLLAYTGNALQPAYRNDPLSSGTPKGFKYVGIQVRMCIVKNNYPDPVRPSWDPWSLTSKDGDTYEPAREYNTGVLVTPLYPDGKATAVGQCRRGWIPFAVPQAWKPDTAEYDPAAGDRLTWQLGP
jgi:hypothetical protein